MHMIFASKSQKEIIENAPAKNVYFQNQKTHSVDIDSGRSKCCYFVCFSYDFWNTCFFVGAFSMNSFQDFDGKIMCIGGAQELKTVEILLRKGWFLFSLLFSIVWNVENNAKFMKFRFSFSVTHKRILEIFIEIWRSTYGKSGFSRIALEFI